MVDFNQMLGGPKATPDDSEMKYEFIKYARNAYKGDFISAVVNRSGSVVLELHEDPDFGDNTQIINISNIFELQNVIQQLVAAGRIKWDHYDDNWKLKR